MPNCALALVVGARIKVEEIIEAVAVPRYCSDTGQRIDDRQVEKRFVRPEGFNKVPCPSRWENIDILTNEHLPELGNLVIFTNGQIIGKMVKRTDDMRLSASMGLFIPVDLSGEMILNTQTELNKLNISGNVGIFTLLLVN